jgi:Fe-S cluster assembly protein SufD
MSAIVDFPVKPEARPYIEAFGREGLGLHQREPDWLASYRKRSLARFAELGFPSRRSEAWRYLDLRALEQKPMLPSGAQRTAGSAAIHAQLAEISCTEIRHRLVLVDGRLAPELSQIGGLPPGVRLGSMAEAIAGQPDLLRSRFEALSLDPGRPFAALNAAFFADGFVLEIAPGVTLDQPIEILHLSSGETHASLHTRSLIVVGAGGRVSLVESFTGVGDYWRNDVVELRLAAGAELARVTLIEEAADALHFGEVLATLDHASRLSTFVLLLGGRTVRHEMTVRSEAEGTRSELNGAFLLSGRQEANILTTVDHAAPGGETREIFKGVAADRSHSAFQGRITVRPGARKVDAHQTSRNLVLGPRAAIDTKPELEIFADDVKCSHGAAVGDLDEAALFYLRARGIPTEEARRLLVDGFLREPLDGIADSVIREHLLRRLSLRLARLEDA